MCGIIGVIGKLPKENEFKKARDVLFFRGPDNYGLYYNLKENVALGHRRLSIIDLSASGRQPFFSNDKRYILIYNGEIYNYLELKKELEGFYDFKTKTDTEVLLASYIKWGRNALSKFNGMFAFAIWDEKEKELFCARDRLGIKPFYYHLDKDQFCFASEIKALLSLGIKARPNEKIIHDYLTYGLYDHNEETFFDKIYNLPSGHYFIYKNKQLQKFKYWDLADVSNKPRKLSEKDAVEKFLDLFADSIKLRLRSDVEVGVNLSSGLDSTSLLFFAEKISGRNLKIFSMRSNDEEYDEGALIEEILTEKQLSKWHTCCLKKEEVPELMDKLILVQDEPYGGIATIAYFQVAELIKENNIKVILEGQGGDEILAGYKYYQPKFLGQTLSQGGFSQDMSREINIKVLRKEFLGEENNFFSFSQPFKSELLNAQYRDIKYSKLPRVLRFNDRISMVNSCEYREPYLDYRIVEFCFFLPDNLKIDPSGQKILLRKAMKDFIPIKPGQRAKKTYGAIQTLWFRKYLKDELMKIFNSKSFRERPYWNQKNVIEEAEKFFNGVGDNSFYIWQWANLELWLRKYID